MKSRLDPEKVGYIGLLVPLKVVEWDGIRANMWRKRKLCCGFDFALTLRKSKLIKKQSCFFGSARKLQKHQHERFWPRCP